MRLFTKRQQPEKPKRTIKVSAFFAWYDLWVGVFIDTKKSAAYICPLPACVIKIEVQTDTLS